ncbi:hypothetical protein EUAN_19980 [Andreesenia angusta]|uniref:Uncharacterized protein n=1 Tax=Andreesenia angusta TaxID=39480 RepID=A0A1S1V559_9FIRM|nr:hypothetical protein EUAN_19980 [Andreesenia angusta]
MPKLPSFLSKKFFNVIEWIGFIVSLVSSHISIRNSSSIESNSVKIMFFSAGVVLLSIIIRKFLEKKGLLRN